MKLNTKDLRVLVVLSVALLVLMGVLLLAEAEFDHPWKKIQRNFIKLDKKISTAELQQLEAAKEEDVDKETIGIVKERIERLKNKGPEIKQFWLTHFNEVDRCMSCHTGVELDRFEGADQPYAKHPGKHIDPDRHVTDKFGCVICHEGQGVGLTVNEAHGQNKHNWMKPLLVGLRAESSCEACHPMRTGVAKEAILEDAPSYSRGRSLYLNSKCLGCHLLGGFERDEGIGPILTKLATKAHPDWSKAWIKTPKAYLANTYMPDFGLPEEEIKAITAYLFSLDSPLKADRDARLKIDNRLAIQKGKQKLTDLGCLGCHAVDGRDENFAPDLSRVAEKTNPEWLFNWISDPKKYWPATSMPNLRVPKEDIQELVAYLLTLKKEEPSKSEPETDPELIETGKLLARDKGCTGCHQIEDFGLGFNAPSHDGIGQKRVDELIFANTKIDKTLAAWLSLKVKDPKAFNSEDMPTLMPSFGFTDDQAEALLIFLLSNRERLNIPEEYKVALHKVDDPLVKGEIIVEESNCRGCHKIGENGGDVGPDLSFEGERINPQWVTKFLEKPTKIRPFGVEPTRMPTFDFTSEEAESLSAYFASRSKVDFPYYMIEKTKSKQQDRDEAWKMYWQNFSCQACHSWNGTGGIVGPDQSDLARRLRREWVKNYLNNPQQYIPDVRMPNFELYPEEAELLSDLIMSFNEIPEAVWDQMRQRWEDEQLAKQAAGMTSQTN